ncbi:MAG: hypothetical protein WCI04_05755, partial [archaeon]
VKGRPERVKGRPERVKGRSERVKGRPERVKGRSYRVIFFFIKHKKVVQASKNLLEAPFLYYLV